ncbi:helix-turn-helix domain-containing protein, partial [Massilia sp. CT11-108]
VAALGAEIEWAARLLDAPAARLVTPEGPRDVLLDEVERLMSSTALVVDGCLNAVHHLGTAIPLARRPILFALVRTLAEAWPQDAARDTLILAAFRIRHPDEHASVLALLADGEAWSSSALALALGTSQRTIQRSLEALAGSGKIQAFGQGRARRWSMLPLPGFATTLLLPTALGVP